ncbi:MAG: hypothetical protein C0613_08010 [Desulfobulbaceae bacterium]|nr:MAG: hypothetical protein C0613_08010 [Desulfobulbaceae bacterium]
MLVAVFLCVSLRHASHVHHQHGPAAAELTSGRISFVAVFSDGHHGDTEPHGEHSHDAPDKTAHLYKHNNGWKTLRGKTDADNQLKLAAFFSPRDIAIPCLEAGTGQAPYVKDNSGTWTGGPPPARAPPTISRLA